MSFEFHRMIGVTVLTNDIISLATPCNTLIEYFIGYHAVVKIWNGYEFIYLQWIKHRIKEHCASMSRSVVKHQLYLLQDEQWKDALDG